MIWVKRATGTGAFYGLLLGMLAGRRFGRYSRFWRRLLFLTLMLGITSTFAILVMNFSIFLLTPLLGLIATIVVLNLKLYAFFFSKRGILFAVAVIPFHLLYFFYSTAAFVMVAGVHAWNTKVKR